MLDVKLRGSQHGEHLRRLVTKAWAGLAGWSPPVTEPASPFGRFGSVHWVLDTKENVLDVLGDVNF